MAKKQPTGKELDAEREEIRKEREALRKEKDRFQKARAKHDKAVKEKKPSGVGRPRVEFDLARIEYLCSINTTMEHIAADQRCSVDTLYNAVKTYPGMAEAIEFGRARKCVSLNEALFKMATRGYLDIETDDNGKIRYIKASHTALIWLSKQCLGYRDGPALDALAMDALKQRADYADVLARVMAIIDESNAVLDAVPVNCHPKLLE